MEPPTSPRRTRANRLSWSERRTAHPGVTGPGQENGHAVGGTARPHRCSDGDSAWNASSRPSVTVRACLHPGCRSRHDNEQTTDGNPAPRVNQRVAKALCGHADTLCDGRAGWGVCDSCSSTELVVTKATTENGPNTGRNSGCPPTGSGRPDPENASVAPSSGSRGPLTRVHRAAGAVSR